MMHRWAPVPISVSYLRGWRTCFWVVDDVLIWCLRTIWTSCWETKRQSEVTAEAGEYSSTDHTTLAGEWEFCACFQRDPVFVPLGMPSAGLSQRHGAKEVSCKQTWSSQVLRLSFDKMLLYLQAVHTGHGLSEAVLPRERLQTSQRVSPASTHLSFG